MRIEICYEDALQYEWFLVKDSMEFAEKVPLSLSYNFTQLENLLGHVTDIRREEDGAITGEMVFHQPSDPLRAKFALEHAVQIEEALERDDMFPSMYANNVTDERCENLRIVYKATLRAVVLLMSPALQGNPRIPEGVLQDESR